MIKDYIKAIILEQINRALYLKSLIPHPIGYPELSSLADRCGRILDENLSHLRYLLRELTERTEEDIRDIFRGLRTCTRYIETIEYFGIPALHYQSEEAEFLNKLIFKIYQEIKLPLTAPSVACFSTKHYFVNPFTNVIFIPVGEPNFLLHLPDIFHEIGHGILFHKENDLRIGAINEKYNEAISIITNYYQELLIKKTREPGPKDEIMFITNIHSQWKKYWINEFFPDLFACYTLGPAYAWSHLHLSTKKSDDVYKLEKILPQSHPSDDSRIKMLLLGLNKLGFHSEVKDLTSKWEKMPFVAHIEPIIEYQYAYPRRLMDEVVDLFLEGLRQSNFSIITPERLEKLGEDSIIKILNDAWLNFWDNCNGFREWELTTIKKIKSVI